MRSSASKPHSTQIWVPQVSFLRPGIRGLLSKGLIFGAVLQCGFTCSAQNAAQAWLKYRPLGKPLTVPTSVKALGHSLVEQTAAIELRRGLLSLSGGAPLEGGPNTIFLGTAEEMRTRDA